ncbi:MAG TPA: hypothetical protein PK142_02805 [bacterium]|nr:hypothetical protein [bacterium]
MALILLETSPAVLKIWKFRKEKVFNGSYFQKESSLMEKNYEPLESP